jgi:hypothetical protein
MTAGFPASSQALDRNDLDLVAEISGAFHQGLDHALHSPGPGPVILREVQNAHDPGNLGCLERPLGLYSAVVPATSPEIPIAVNREIRLRPAIADVRVCHFVSISAGVRL